MDIETAKQLIEHEKQKLESECLELVKSALLEKECVIKLFVTIDNKSIPIEGILSLPIELKIVNSGRN